MTAEVVETIPLRGMRQTIARRMTASLQEMAQLTLHRTLDPAALLDARDWLRRAGLTVNDVIAGAVVGALQTCPAVNATLEDGVIQRYGDVNLGVAVAVDGGLVVPVLEDAQRMSLAELGAESRRLAERARAGDLLPEEMIGGTFTLSNLGAFGIDGFTPIVNPPQVAILGVGALRARGLGLSLTIDHRALDGVPGAEFLARLATTLESPDALDRLVNAPTGIETAS